MSYATVEDVQKRMTRALTEAEQTACATLLEDAAVLIDAYNANASADAKLIVSCHIAARMFGDSNDIPVGATQGSMSGLGYAQSWTIGGGGATGEIYLSKTDKRLLGVGNRIGSRSPLEDYCDEGNNGTTSD